MNIDSNPLVWTFYGPMKCSTARNLGLHFSIHPIMINTNYGSMPNTTLEPTKEHMERYSLGIISQIYKSINCISQPIVWTICGPMSFKTAINLGFHFEIQPEMITMKYGIMPKTTFLILKNHIERYGGVELEML
jgi:hypothetical protein